MSTLAQLQGCFAAAVLRRETGALDGMLAGDSTHAAVRTGIYINNHHIGLRDALAAIFPVLGRVLGSESFELLARSFVDTHPKPSGNLLDYGDQLADFIAETQALADLPYLADLARLEWLRHQLARAADADPGRSLSLSSLATLDDAALAALRLRCVLAAQLFQSPYPVLRVWHSNQDTEPTLVSLDEGGVKGLLLRAGLEVRFEALGNAEFAFLTALDEHTVCAAAEAALQLDPHFDLALTLARGLNWLQHENPRSAWR